MNRQTIFRAVAAVAVMRAVNTGAQAQLGGALNRARNAVQNTGNRSSTPGKPSAEAVAADPRAGVEQAEEGYTKSPAQIRGAYEALDSKFYFLPYYHPNLRRYFLLDDSQEELDFFANQCLTVDEHYRAQRLLSNLRKDEGTIVSNRLTSLTPESGSKRYYHFVDDTIPAGNKGCPVLDGVGVMPVGIHALYAGFALFAADPKGLKPFMRYCEARNLAVGMTKVFVSVSTDSRTERPVLTRDGRKELPIRWEDVFGYNVRNQAADLDALMKKETPLGVIKEAATYYNGQVKKYEAEKDYANARYYFHVLEMALHFWIEKEGNKGADFRPLFADYAKYDGMYDNWSEMELAGGAPIEMPATFPMAAGEEAKILAAANVHAAKGDYQAAFKVDKVVFITDDRWAEAKQPEWPFRFINRNRAIAFLTNDNGQWIIRRTRVYQDSVNGIEGWKDEYRFGYLDQMDAKPRPVNYKP